MATQIEPTAPPAPTPASQTGRRVAAIVAIALGVAALIAVAVEARPGAVADRIKNPSVTGAPRPVEPLFGFHS